MICGTKNLFKNRKKGLDSFRESSHSELVSKDMVSLGRRRFKKIFSGIFSGFELTRMPGPHPGLPVSSLRVRPFEGWLIEEAPDRFSPWGGEAGGVTFVSLVRQAQGTYGASRSASSEARGRAR